MKLSLILMLVCTLQLSASVSLGQQVTVQSGESSLSSILDDLNEQTGTIFMYNKEDVDDRASVELDMNGGNLEEVLDEICKQTSLQYEIIDEFVVITKKAKKVEQPVQQENKSIQGKVIDKDGFPLPGVSVVVKGTSTGVATDIDGNYSIQIESNTAVLVYSFVGMLPQEVVYNGQSVQNITLTTDSEQMAEVVVVGYGTQKREDIGSAIATVDSKQIGEQAAGASTIEQILGGQIKGVQISQGSGAPGSASTIRVRGITSPFSSGNNQPLYVIDGVVFNSDAVFDVGAGGASVATENPLMGIDPKDIENISVLKDAGATAIYGSRGANGVIIITTKGGKLNTANSVNVDYTFSLANPLNKQDVLGVEDFKSLHQMIAANTIDAYDKGYASSGGYGLAALILDVNNNNAPNETVFGMPVWGDSETDWQDQVYNSAAQTHQWNVSLTGGNKSTRYAFSVNHTDQEGLLINDNLKRYGARMNMSSEIKSWLIIGGVMNYNHTNNQSGGAQLLTDGASAAMVARPDFDVFNEDGIYNRFPDQWYNYPQYGFGGFDAERPNPVASRLSQIVNKSDFFNGNAFVTLKPIEGLTVKAKINASSYRTVGRRFRPIDAQTTSVFSVAQSSLNNSLSQTSSVVSDFQALYRKTLNEKHAISAMIGYSVDNRYYTREYQSYQGTLEDDILTNAASMLSHIETLGGETKSIINSYYSRLQYSYDRRYSATFNFRSDKSTKFGPGNKVAYFPSVALNWNVTNESFMQDVSFVNNLKLRTSYGETGSANVSDFNYLQFFQVGSGNQAYYGSDKTIVNSSVFANPNIGWETTSEFNVGVDFNLFNNVLSGSVDVYNKNTDGILSPTPIFAESGATEFTSNRAEVSNKGFEIELGANIINTDDLRWSVNFNLARNINKVEDISGTAINRFLADYFIEGEPIGAIKGFKVEGIIQEASVIDKLNTASPIGVYYQATTGPGDYLYKDKNEDGKINEEDEYVLGSMQPDFFGGFSTSLNYKGFELGAFFQFSVGADKMWPGHASLISRADIFKNMSPEALNNTWTPDRKDAKYTRLIYENSFNSDANSATLQDASYLRLKVLRLSYTLPKDLLDNKFFKSAMFHVSATNLLTITGYEGLDPEASSGFITDGARGSDVYPYARTFSAGVSVKF